MVKTVICSLILTAAGYLPAATFYIDPVNGSDTGDGSAASPWKRIGSAVIPSGAGKAAAGEDNTVILKGGHYGSLEINGTSFSGKASSGTWTTYKAARGETPVFSSINIRYPDRTPVNLRFDGVHILPGSAPAAGAAGKAAFVPTEPFGIFGVSNLIYENGRIWGATRQTHTGLVWVEDCSNITIRRNEIGNGSYGIKYIGSSNCKALYNHIYLLSSSGIKYMANNRDCVFEGNHIHDQVTWDGSHASAISIRSGNLIIRGNIIHDGFTSSGMMLYDSDGSRKYYFSNITIENNLLYDIANMYCLRLYNLVSNIVIRNNTFIAYKRDVNDGRYAMETAIAGCTGVSQVYNNITIGAVYLGGAPSGKNIMWSCNNNNVWVCTLGTNVIKTCSATNKPLSYFENGFFMQKPNFNPSHGLLMDYRLAPGSPAIGFGDPSKQPATSLGTLGADGFITPDGPARDSAHHSCGAYEFGAGQVVVERVFTTLKVSPVSATVQPGKQVLFTARALDQYSSPLVPQPAITWSIGGGQVISAVGMFTAGQAEGGPYTVTAQTTAGGITKTTQAAVTVAVSWQDDFNGSKKQTWYTGGGTWSVVGDQLKNTGTGRMETWAGEPGWGDITVTAEMTPTQGDVWLLFRVQDKDNYYLFTLAGPSGYGELYKLVNGAYTKIQGSTTPFVTGAVHQVKVELTGSTIRIYKGTSLVLQAADSQFGQGFVGVGGNSATGAFDNVTVTFGGGNAIIDRQHMYTGQGMQDTAHGNAGIYTVQGSRVTGDRNMPAGIYLRVDENGKPEKLIFAR